MSHLVRAYLLPANPQRPDSEPYRVEIRLDTAICLDHTNRVLTFDAPQDLAAIRYQRDALVVQPA